MPPLRFACIEVHDAVTEGASDAHRYYARGTALSGSHLMEVHGPLHQHSGTPNPAEMAKTLEYFCCSSQLKQRRPAPTSSYPKPLRVPQELHEFLPGSPRPVSPLRVRNVTFLRSTLQQVLLAFCLLNACLAFLFSGMISTGHVSFKLAGYRHGWSADLRKEVRSCWLASVYYLLAATVCSLWTALPLLVNCMRGWGTLLWTSRPHFPFLRRSYEALPLVMEEATVLRSSGETGSEISVSPRTSCTVVRRRPVIMAVI